MSVCQGCGTPIPPSRRGRPRKWCSDRCRKAQYGGTCVDCGGPTDGSNGRSGQPRRCSPCAHRYEHESRAWTAESVVAAIRDYAARFRRTPGVRDFDLDERYPSSTTVFNVCGSWNAALRAAGLEPVREFERPYEADPTVLDRVVALYREGYSTYEIAPMFNVSPARVRQWLIKAGEPRRSSQESRRLHLERAAA